MGPRAGLNRCGKSRSHRNSIPGPSSPWPVAMLTEISGPHKCYSFSLLYFICSVPLFTRVALDMPLTNSFPAVIIIIMPPSFHSLAVVLTLVTNKNKCAQTKQYENTVHILPKHPHNCQNTHTYTLPHVTKPTYSMVQSSS